MAGNIAILVMLGIVAVILLGGIAVMALGGEASAKWSNVLMRYRILAQAIALVVIGLVVYVASGR
ncbi:heme/copper-type cytochrome/quinol oxidase subunit 2 [Rhizomicrobium palustre]|uniref:Heme/copper-type cytochrome/quinol oxidase subunit 2 n=1 Tax=Rhizomicrobium palustre TaxID=189966 RepID=A0A846MXH4_9PROT|nr:HIG1 domain-containing protein [Rhizomicrobium palustre]NIK88274.1 heme/copper-type cytochrome/quinol oxidase subunit 2 [Rhizomicrobium palustre]